MLDTIFKGVVAFETQYVVSNYRIDFYLPVLNLAVEYDENHHRYKQHKDKMREKEIKNILGCSFLRVKEGQELEAVNKILILNKIKGDV
jgi:very-short-patch-repair endonuclease